MEISNFKADMAETACCHSHHPFSLIFSASVSQPPHGLPTVFWPRMGGAWYGALPQSPRARPSSPLLPAWKTNMVVGAPATAPAYGAEDHVLHVTKAGWVPENLTELPRLTLINLPLYSFRNGRMKPNVFESPFSVTVAISKPILIG